MRFWRLVPLAVVLIGISIGCTETQRPQEQQPLHELYELSLDELRALAEGGHANAQTMLGLHYMVGEGVPQDDAAALRWVRLAADQGDADGQFALGAMYQDGRGVPQDNAEALRWVRLAADQGDADAQYALGLTFATGRAVKQDQTEAARWFRLAADQAYEAREWRPGPNP